jgi:hypothetical protein
VKAVKISFSIGGSQNIMHNVMVCIKIGPFGLGGICERGSISVVNPNCRDLQRCRVQPNQSMLREVFRP